MSELSWDTLRAVAGRPQLWLMPPEMDLEIHPEALRQSVMGERDYQELVANMREHGFREEFPIRLLDGKLLDGRHRYRAAREAGVPFCVEALPLGTDPELFSRQANDLRRHDPEGVEQRRQRVLQRRQQGESLRTIAAAEGVSHHLVEKDLAAIAARADPEDPTVTPLTPATVTGRNGKTYQATRKPVPVPQPDGAIDAEGHPIPASIQDAFADLEPFAQADRLCRELQQLIDQLVLRPGGELLGRWVQARQLRDVTTYESEALNKLKAHLRDRPHSVCPHCAGNRTPGCKGCSGRGWVTKLTWASISPEVQEKLPCI